MSEKHLDNKNNKKQSYLNEKLVLLTICSAIQLAVFFIACIIALITDVKSNILYSFCIASLCFGGFISGFVAVSKIKKNGMLNGVLYTLPANLTFVLISVVLNKFNIDYFIAVSLLLMVVSGAFGGIFAVNTKPKAKIKKR